MRESIQEGEGCNKTREERKRRKKRKNERKKWEKKRKMKMREEAWLATKPDGLRYGARPARAAGSLAQRRAAGPEEVVQVYCRWWKWELSAWRFERRGVDRMTELAREER